ncbi:hypothetical protein DSO57_1039081 [Entomophthora muscae]|uniref:Uncharacterized protein n=1 Tax=Entomophthora muscae TaxID=34485 RepID=A0ACC2S0D5_9FUNG|nr:hypothetical protein DSO57_1039081 [Entomophthora muscae]
MKDTTMQENFETKWEKISKEFHLDDAAITHLKEIGKQDAILSGFFEDLGQYLGLNSFSDLCSQFSELKTSLDTSKTELSQASQRIASLEAMNEKLLLDKDDALHSLQLQISDSNYFREKSLATGNELQNLKGKIYSLETNKFNLGRRLTEVETEKRRRKIKQKLLKAENHSLKNELRATKDILGSYRAEKESQFQQLQCNLQAVYSEYHMARSATAEFQAKNRELHFEIDALQTKLKASQINLNLEIKHMKNELSIQTKLAESYRQLFTDSEAHKEILKKEVAGACEDFEKLCTETEAFRKEAISKHNFLLAELEVLRVQHNQNNSNNAILDLSHVSRIPNLFD